MLRVLLLMLALIAAPALAQTLPTSKPPPLGAPMAQTPSPSAGGLTCAAPLANACLAQQSACQVACPGLWSMNPSAPAFTPTDRAGCMAQCMQRYLACRRLHGC